MMSDDDIKDNLPLEGLLSKILRLQYQLHTLEEREKELHLGINTSQVHDMQAVDEIALHEHERLER